MCIARLFSDKKGGSKAGDVSLPRIDASRRARSVDRSLGGGFNSNKLPNAPLNAMAKQPGSTHQLHYSRQELDLSDLPLK